MAKKCRSASTEAERYEQPDEILIKEIETLERSCSGAPHTPEQTVTKSSQTELRRLHSRMNFLIKIMGILASSCSGQAAVALRPPEKEIGPYSLEPRLRAAAERWLYLVQQSRKQDPRSLAPHPRILKSDLEAHLAAKHIHEEGNCGVICVSSRGSPLAYSSPPRGDMRR